MYKDEIFEKALQQRREESFEGLKDEITAMECAIEKFLNSVLECTASISERDFNVTTL